MLQRSLHIHYSDTMPVNCSIHDFRFGVNLCDFYCKNTVKITVLIKKHKWYILSSQFILCKITAKYCILQESPKI